MACMSKNSFLNLTHLCAAFLLLISWAPVSAQVGADRDDSTRVAVTIATGLTGSIYHRIALRAEELSANSSISIKALPTDGSLDALSRVQSGEAAFAIAQWDAISTYAASMNDDSLLWALRPLYQEYLHVLVYTPLNLSHLSDIAGKRVYLGAGGSGTRYTSRKLLGSIGIGMSQVNELAPKGSAELKQLLINDEIEVIMQVGPAGDPLVRNLLATGKCRLLSLGTEVKRMLTVDVRGKHIPAFIQSEIPKNSYNRQHLPVSTVAVAAVLVGNRGVSHEITAAVDSLVSAALELTRDKSADMDLLLPRYLPNPDALSWLKPEMVPRPSPVKFWLNILVVSVIAFAAVFWLLLSKYKLRFLQPNRNRLITTLIGAVIIICIVCSILIYSAEHTVNPHFETMYETAWSMFVYITSGLENRSPITPIGRALGTVLLLAGPVLMVLLTGYLASSMVVKALEKRMAENQKDHYVILNWSPRTREIIRQLHAPDVKATQRTTIVVISDDPKLNLNELKSTDDGKWRRRHSEFKDVFFSPGDPTDKHSLLNANVDQARAVLIMTNDSDSNGGDESTLRSLSILEDIADESSVDGKPGKPDHIIVELRSIKNVAVVERVRKTFRGNIDVISAGQMRTLLLAQATSIPGLTEFYTELLSYSSKTSAVFAVDIPNEVAERSMSFAEYAAHVMLNTDDDPVIPVGLVRQNKEGRRIPITNPIRKTETDEENEYYTLKEGDQLIVIARRPPKRLPLPG